VWLLPPRVQEEEYVRTAEENLGEGLRTRLAETEHQCKVLQVRRILRGAPFCGVLRAAAPLWPRCGVPRCSHAAVVATLFRITVDHSRASCVCVAALAAAAC
jgi:hypothetical protein